VYDGTFFAKPAYDVFYSRNTCMQGVVQRGQRNTVFPRLPGEVDEGILKRLAFILILSEELPSEGFITAQHRLVQRKNNLGSL
jgi:hypothetical protein